MPLSPEEIQRYKRHLVLKEVGGQGQQKLKAARVLLVGAGGLGARALCAVRRAWAGWALLCRAIEAYRPARWKA